MHPFPSLWLKRKSIKIKHFWATAFEGVTALETFYEIINFGVTIFSQGSILPVPAEATETVTASSVASSGDGTHHAPCRGLSATRTFHTAGTKLGMSGALEVILAFHFVFTP